MKDDLEGRKGREDDRPKGERERGREREGEREEEREGEREIEGENKSHGMHDNIYGMCTVHAESFMVTRFFYD